MHYLWSVLGNVNSVIHWKVIISLMKVPKMFSNIKLHIIKFNSFELKPVFISCEFNISGVIAFYAFIWQLEIIVWSTALLTSNTTDQSS